MTIILLMLVLVLSVYALVSKDLLHGIIVLSAISLLCALMFYLMHAPDVAITEAAVGAGITTVIYIGVIRNTERKDKSG